MATGLLIRDFFKEYRELRYSNSGSISISNIEHNAYRLSLTLEITHIDAPRYGSLKTLPENTHYGYVTLFRGSTVTDTIPIKYPKFRIFDINNQGIWNYHQDTESLQLLAGGFQSLINEQSTYFVATPGFVSFDTCRTLRFLFPPGADPVADLVLRLTGCEDPLAGDGERELSSGYRAFPIATPFPDIIKFKADVPCSFLWRLEAWFLVNPAVYIVDNPTDAGDETEGEDEYPVPEQGDGDGDGNEFPPSDPPGPGSDFRDFPQLPEGTMYRYRVLLSGTLLSQFGTAAPYSNEIEFDLSSPNVTFVADAGPNVITFAAGESWFSGVEIRSSSNGQLVFTFNSSVGFRRGGHTVSRLSVVPIV